MADLLIWTDLVIGTVVAFGVLGLWLVFQRNLTLAERSAHVLNEIDLYLSQAIVHTPDVRAEITAQSEKINGLIVVQREILRLEQEREQREVAMERAIPELTRLLKQSRDENT